MMYAIVKAATGVIVHTSVGFVVGNAIKATTPVLTTKAAKAGVVIGAMALTSYVGDKVSTDIEERMDGIVAMFKDIKVGSKE